MACQAMGDEVVADSAYDEAPGCSRGCLKPSFSLLQLLNFAHVFVNNTENTRLDLGQPTGKVSNVGT